MNCAAALLLPEEAALAHFCGTTYRASVIETRAVGFALLAALAAINAFWPTPATPSEAGGRGTVTVGAILLTAWYYGTRNPYHKGDSWKWWLQLGSLVIAALATTLTHLSLAAELYDSRAAVSALATGGESTSSTSAAAAAAAAAARVGATGLAFAIVVGTVALALALLGGFGVATVRGVRAEEALLKAAAAAARIGTSASAHVSAITRGLARRLDAGENREDDTTSITSSSPPAGSLAAQAGGFIGGGEAAGTIHIDNPLRPPSYTASVTPTISAPINGAPLTPNRSRLPLPRAMAVRPRPMLSDAAPLRGAVS